MALITPVQQIAAHSTGTVASIVQALGSPVTAGNVLIVTGGVWNTGDVNAVSDTLGTVYTLISAGAKIRYWRGVAPSSGACTVTVTVTGVNNYMCIALTEIPAGTYTYTGQVIVTSSTSTPATNSYTVTDTGSLLLGMMTCQGDPSGTITEDGAWTLVNESTNFSFLPYSFIWRNANAGSYTASWTLGANITTYREGLLIEGTPDPITKTGCFILGGTENGASTVNTTHTGYIALDDVARTVSGEGVAFVGGALGLYEQATSPTAVTNVGMLYVEDNGSGKSRLVVKFGTGAAIVLATEV